VYPPCCSNHFTALEKSAEATFLIGKILENIDHHTEAEEYYRRSILRDPHNSYYQEELAMFFLRQKRFEEALQAALSVIKLDGRHFPYLLQRITPKIQDPLRLQVLVPEDEKSQLFWLNFLRDHNFLDIALTTAIQNRQRFTSCPNPFMMAAIEIETLQKKSSDADKDLEKFSQQCPQARQDFLWLKAKLNSDIHKNSPETLNILTEILAINPSHQQARNAIDLANQLSQASPALLKQWDTALEGLLLRYPNQESLLQAKALSRELSGDWLGAIEIVKLLNQQHLLDIGYKKRLASLYIKRKMYGQGLQIYRDLLKQQPEDVETRLDLATAYLELNLQEQALKLVEEGLRLAPTNSRLTAWRTKIKP
jgi:tetratricopeptide (TPR) repeat protein